jgi:hypothetical protein
MGTSYKLISRSAPNFIELDLALADYSCNEGFLHNILDSFGSWVHLILA